MEPLEERSMIIPEVDLGTLDSYTRYQMKWVSDIVVYDEVVKILKEKRIPYVIHHSDDSICISIYDGNDIITDLKVVFTEDGRFRVCKYVYRDVDPYIRRITNKMFNKLFFRIFDICCVEGILIVDEDGDTRNRIVCYCNKTIY